MGECLVRRATSALLAVAVAAGAGATLFSALRTPAEANFAGPFAGGTQGSGGALTSEGVVEALLGEDFSANSLVLTDNDTASDGLVLMGSRLRFVPNDVNANAYMYFDTSTGFFLGNQLNLADGAFLTADNLAPKRASQSLSVYGSNGMTLVCQNALPGTACGTSPIVQGTSVCLNATATSRTRVCTCTASSDSSPTYAWALNGGAGTVGDATTCPEVTP